MFFSNHSRHLLILIVCIGLYGLLSHHTMGSLPTGTRIVEYEAWPWVIGGFSQGLPEWPGIALQRFTGDPLAAPILHLCLGGLLLILVHRFLRFHGSLTASTISALLLATNTQFVLDTQAQGGGALLGQAATLLCLWAFWSRRWAGGRHGLTALGIGLGLGLMAHLRFGWVFAAMAVCAALLRWDKPNLRPPLPSQPWMPLVWTGLLTLPYVMTWSLDGLPPQPEWIPFSASLQPIEAREWLGFAFVISGVFTAWKERHPTPQIALLRFVSVWVVLMIGIEWTTGSTHPTRGFVVPVMAIMGGLAIDRLASWVSPPRSFTRTLIALALAAPLIAAGAGWSP